MDVLISEKLNDIMDWEKGKKEGRTRKRWKKLEDLEGKSILSKNQFHINGKSFQYPHTECGRECWGTNL